VYNDKNVDDAREVDAVVARSSDRDVTRGRHLVSFMSHAADAQRAMSAATAVKTITVRAIMYDARDRTRDEGRWIGWFCIYPLWRDRASMG